LTRLRAMRVGLANGGRSGWRAKRSSVMSKPKSPPVSRAAVSNVLLVEVPPQFIALCEASGANP